MSTTGRVLGIVMFGLGSLRWLSLGEGDEEGKFSGWALHSQSSQPTD